MRIRNNVNSAAAVLWASAFILTALVITQAGSLPGNPAYADMAVESGGFTLLTVDAGRGNDCDPEELLYVIDSRDEVLLVYEIEDTRQKQIVLRGGGSLSNLFINARQ